MRRATLALGCCLLSACAGGFSRYNTGIGVLYVGDRVAVESACVTRGLVVPVDHRVYGCTDFSAREMFAVNDPAVISHEFCRLALFAGTGDTRCPIPVLP